MIIGLSGYSSSGKDEVAKILIKDHGYKRIAFADAIREALYELNPFVSERLRVTDLVDEYGWDFAKKNAEVRRLLQIFGTEVGRAQFGEDVWAMKVLNELDFHDKVVVTDVRFGNEFYGIKWNHGEMWRVERPGIEPANDHVSEHALDGWEFDRVIKNAGSLDDLAELVAEVMK